MRVQAHNLFNATMDDNDDDCNLDAIHVAMVATICGGVLITILSVITVATNSVIDTAVRHILLSFSLANFVSTIMLTYNAYTIICAKPWISSLMTISVLLSLCHLMLLLLAEYIIIMSKTRSAKDFIGLILISWISSITVGTLNVVSHETTAVILPAVTATLIIISIVCYILLVRKHRMKKKLKRIYHQTFLRTRFASKLMKIHWLPLMAVIFISYACFTVLWLINEFKSNSNSNKAEDKKGNTFHSVSLIGYSLNFYFPSVICIYLRYQIWVSQKRFGCRHGGSRLSYRYRDGY